MQNELRHAFDHTASGHFFVNMYTNFSGLPNPHNTHTQIKHIVLLI